MESLFLLEWNDKLENSKLFPEGTKEFIVNKENLSKVLSILELDSIIRYQEAENLLSAYGDSANFEELYKDLYASLNKIADSEFEYIVASYNTPAERIVKSLVQLENKYLKEDPQMAKEINYAISKINDRKIYASSQDDT